ncbi:hypothetical protein PHYBOEH_007790 [Phytophthora boehmeriae]|uniref:RxLR effector protein n=1 Tax=Phytophthora boehmeriae TaxID=109152 RepID=A0A8T1W3T6_9STRA|nr:hypothetical protein PHYBOEH_007790 [Phytophthora boehmeriae]
MRVSCFLFAVAAVLLTSVDTASGVSPTDLSPLSALDSAPVVYGNRFLRVRETIEDEEVESKYDSEDNSEEEERGIVDLIKSISFDKLDDVAKDLRGTPGAAKYIQGENTELFKAIAARKWTPESMAEKFGIAAKKAAKTKEQLKFDPEYQLWKHFRKFWNARKAQA